MTGAFALGSVFTWMDLQPSSDLSHTQSVGAPGALRVHLENVGGYWSRSGIPRLQLRSNRVQENYLSREGETGGGRKSQQTTYKRVPAGATLMSLFALF